MKKSIFSTICFLSIILSTTNTTANTKYDESVKGKCIFILGAGQVGEACAVRLIKEQPRTIILHTLTEQEALTAIKNVQRVAENVETEIIPSWGNILVPNELMLSSRKELLQNPNNRKIFLDYLYSYLTDELMSNSALYRTIEKYKPNIIIDGINTATVIGYQDDPYSLPRKVMGGAVDWKKSCFDLLSASIIPALVRFTQTLKKALEDFNVDSYIKVSTTGLGGMGVNLMYTHGDVNEPGMSSGILGKVAAAGVMHQLFWSLSHTPGVNIKVVAPAALIGWQSVGYGKFRSHGKNIPLIDNTNKIKLENGNLLQPGTTKKIKKFMEIPFVDSGENCAYSLGEMTAITALGQMECITKEEVAQAVFESIKGSTRYDLSTAMDCAAMGPSFPGAMQRTTVLEKLKNVEIEQGIPSIATNNLGPTTSKHLFELHILLGASDNSLEKCTQISTANLVKKIETFIQNNQEVRAQALSLGLPIIFDNGEVLMGEYFLVPYMNEQNVITPENIDKWAHDGWVDLREQRVKFWQFWLSQARADSADIAKKEIAVLNRNWRSIEDGNIGELLGYIYSLQGGNRRTEF